METWLCPASNLLWTACLCFYLTGNLMMEAKNVPNLVINVQSSEAKRAV